MKTKRIYAYAIILTGLFGFMIMPTDRLSQALSGLTMIVLAMHAGTLNWISIYRELIRINRWLGMDTPLEAKRKEKLRERRGEV